MSYTGAISDSTTGLSYMNARYYNPATGTFTSQDTYYGSAYSPWTQHLYSYTGGNPVNYTDPTGHRFVEFATMEGEKKKDDPVMSFNEADYDAYRKESRKLSDNLHITNNASIDTNMIGGVTSGVTIVADAALIVGGVSNAAGYISGLSKINGGIAGVSVALDVGVGVYNNISNDSPASKTINDAVCDFTISGTNAAIVYGATSATSATIIAFGIGGTAICPVIGTIAGLVVGACVAYALYRIWDSSENGEPTLRETVKRNSYQQYLNDPLPYIN